MSCCRQTGWAMKAVVTAVRPGESSCCDGGFPPKADGRTECSAPSAVVTSRLLHSVVALSRFEGCRARSRPPMTVRPAAPDYGVPVTARLASVLEQLGRIVVGKDTPLKLALACLLARGHLLIEDIPGVGKSTLAQALAAMLGLHYARIQFTSDLLPADVLGVSIFDPAAHSFRFHS